jgi:ketosteroid isomerase-like protein
MREHVNVGRCLELENGTCLKLNSHLTSSVLEYHCRLLKQGAKTMVKIFSSLIGILGCLGISSFAYSSTGSSSQIAEFMSAMTEAYNSGDHKKISEMYSSDGQMFTLAGGIYRNNETASSGLSELQQFLKDVFDNFSISSESIVHEIRFVGGDVAIVDTVSKVSQSGQATCGISIFTLVKVQQEWKIKTSTPMVPNPGHTKDHGRRISWYDYCKTN